MKYGLLALFLLSILPGCVCSKKSNSCRKQSSCRRMPAQNRPAAPYVDDMEMDDMYMEDMEMMN